MRNDSSYKQTRVLHAKSTLKQIRKLFLLCHNTCIDCQLQSIHVLSKYYSMYSTCIVRVTHVYFMIQNEKRWFWIVLLQVGHAMEPGTVFSARKIQKFKFTNSAQQIDDDSLMTIQSITQSTLQEDEK